MDYKVLLAGKWNVLDIVKCLEEENGILTYVSNEKYLAVTREYSKPIIIFSIVKMVKLFSEFISKNPHATLISITETEDPELHKCVKNFLDIYSHLYDPELEIIFSYGVVTELHNHFSSVNDKSKKDDRIKIGLFSAGKAETNIIALGYVYTTLFGYNVIPRIDIGVDNLKKTKSVLNLINDVDIIITSAGMEAVLPTVINGLSYKPVIAVPSNIGFGLGADGVAGLYSIMTSENAGLAIFNISNIYGACIFANKIGKHLINRKGNFVNMSSKELCEIFENRYSKNLDVTCYTNGKQCVIKKIGISKKKEDLANAIKLNVPIMNLEGKITQQINSFVQNKKYYVLRNNTTKKFCEIESDCTFKSPLFEYGNLVTNISDEDIGKRKKLYYHKKPVLIVCGGISDECYADELHGYLRLNGIDTTILHNFDMNYIILHEDDIKELMLEHSICIVVVGLNGTLSNIVGKFFASTDIPVIAVPVSHFGHALHDERATVMSMLNNCVGGIAIVERNNLYSAACLTLSILNNFSVID